MPYPYTTSYHSCILLVYLDMCVIIFIYNFPVKNDSFAHPIGIYRIQYAQSLVHAKLQIRY